MLNAVNYSDSSCPHVLKFASRYIRSKTHKVLSFPVTTDGWQISFFCFFLKPIFNSETRTFAVKIYLPICLDVNLQGPFLCRKQRFGFIFIFAGGDRMFCSHDYHLCFPKKILLKFINESDWSNISLT